MSGYPEPMPCASDWTAGGPDCCPNKAEAVLGGVPCCWECWHDADDDVREAAAQWDEDHGARCDSCLGTGKLEYGGSLIGVGAVLRPCQACEGTGVEQ